MIINMNAKPGQIPSAPPDRKKPVKGEKPAAKATTVNQKRDTMQFSASVKPQADASSTSLQKIGAARTTSEFTSSVARPNVVPGPSSNARRLT